jgi:hypothetical protein
LPNPAVPSLQPRQYRPAMRPPPAAFANTGVYGPRLAGVHAKRYRIEVSTEMAKFQGAASWLLTVRSIRRFCSQAVTTLACLAWQRTGDDT